MAISLGGHLASLLYRTSCHELCCKLNCWHMTLHENDELQNVYSAHIRIKALSLSFTQCKPCRCTCMVSTPCCPYRRHLVFGMLAFRWDSFGRLIQSSAARIPWQVIEGNHEQEVVEGELGFLAYEKRFHTPSYFSESNTNLYYSYEVAGLHVIMLGCYVDFSRKSEQYEWLEKDLAKVDRSRTPWLIVGMHAPWYNSNVAHQGEMEGMKGTMESLLYQYGVDIVFAGHVHAYERSSRVYKGHLNNLGPVYINIGDGGNREGLSNDYIKPSPKWSAFREPSFGMGMLNVLNSTHAVWQWHRNQDGDMIIADNVDIVRLMQLHGSGRDVLALHTQALVSKLRHAVQFLYKHAPLVSSFFA